MEKDLPVDLQADGPTFWPHKVLDRRQQLQDGEIRQQVLIEWQEGGLEGVTWEDVGTIQDQFPDFNLEDKVDNQATGIVGVWRVYERKRRVK